MSHATVPSRLGFTRHAAKRGVATDPFSSARYVCVFLVYLFGNAECIFLLFLNVIRVQMYRTLGRVGGSGAVYLVVSNASRYALIGYNARS